MYRQLFASAAAVFVITGVALPAFAQPTPPAAASTATVSAAQRKAVLDDVRAKVKALYVFPEKRAVIIDRLNKSEKAGRYDLDNPAAFSDAVTSDLIAASNDKHMYLVYDPARAAASSKAADAEAAKAQDEAFWSARARRENHGLTETKILPGNIRYLKINIFHWVEDESGQAYDDAVRFLKGGDAVILDLRGNGGGAAEAVNYLTSHFVKGDTLLLTFHRGSETPSQSRAQDYLPAGRLIGKPLYVLTDTGCFSACEEFAYHVEQFKLGELVGGKTGGGANNNDIIAVGPEFMLSISAGRPVHAISGTNWEGVGIKPAVEASSRQALDVALQRALTKLAASPGVSPEARDGYLWSLAEVEARITPPALSPQQLQAFVGRYGEVEVTVREGSLWYRRADRPERRLAPLNDKGLFSVEGTPLRVEFQGDTLKATVPNAPPLTFKRG